MTEEEIQKKHEERRIAWEKECAKLAKTELWDVTVREFAVYVGGLTTLVDISDRLKYHEEQCEECGGDTVISISLQEIYEQVSKLLSHEYEGKRVTPLITVVRARPIRTTIYQCGNHEEGCWEELGEVQGYA